MNRVLVVSLLLLLAVAAGAEDIEILVIRYVTDLPLAQAIEETAALGELEVAVEPALREKKITIYLEHPLVGALKAMAEAAGGHLWKLGDAKYAVRREAPPPEKTPPLDEILDPLEREGADAPPPPPRPEWEQKIQKAMDETLFEGAYEKTPLPQVLADIAGQAGVPLHLDPALTRGKTRKELLVDYEHPPLGGDPSVYEVMTIFCGFEQLCASAQWGVLFVTPFDRWREMPDDVFLGSTDGLPEGLLETRISLDLRKASIRKAVQTVEKKAAVTIRIAEEAAKHCRTRKLSIRVPEITLRQLLSLILVPEGLGLRVDGEGLLVVPLVGNAR